MVHPAATGNNRIAAENFYQHAEHYFRINDASRDRNSQEQPARPCPPMRGPETGSSRKG
jgi:hypothetical protein